MRNLDLATLFYNPHPEQLNYGLRLWSRLSESSTLLDFPFIFAGCCFDFFHVKIAQNKNNMLIFFIYCVLGKRKGKFHLSWNNYFFLQFLLSHHLFRTRGSETLS